MDPHRPNKRLTRLCRFATIQISPAFVAELSVVLLLLSFLLYLAYSILRDLPGLWWKILPLLYCFYFINYHLEGHHIPERRFWGRGTPLSVLEAEELEEIIRKQTEKPRQRNSHTSSAAQVN